MASPLLANVYLHYAFDLWAERWRRREATGDMIIVRYADDIIVGFEHEDDAQRFRDAMRARLQEFSLSLHPKKTRLIAFGRHVAKDRARRGLGKPETFNFLGFTFICGKSRRGKFLLMRKTRRDRMRVKLRNQGGDATTKTPADPRTGGVAGTSRDRLLQLSRGADQSSDPDVFRSTWSTSGGVRSDDAAREDNQGTDQEACRRLAPKAANPSSLARERFAVKHPRWEPYAGIPPVRFCARGARK